MCVEIDDAERDARRGAWMYYIECSRTCAASLRGLNGPGGSKGGNTYFFGCAIFEEVKGA